MSVPKTPAPDAPAEEWGRLAECIPDWRRPWPDDATNASIVMPGFWKDRTWHRADNIVGICCGSADPTVPDPDHWAWEGWLRRMLGAGCRVWQDPEDGLWTVEIGGVRASMYPILGRAMIAAAAALGRWPGGGK